MVQINGETASFDFGLNGSSIDMDLVDVEYRHRFLWFYFGATLNHSIWNARKPEEEEAGFDENEVELALNGLGGNLGAIVPIGDGALVSCHFNAVDTSNVYLEPIVNDSQQIKDRTVNPGPRLDGDIFGRVTILDPWLEGILGFRWRSQAFEIDGDSFREQTTANYLGLQIGGYY